MQKRFYPSSIIVVLFVQSGINALDVVGHAEQSVSAQGGGPRLGHDIGVGKQVDPQILIQQIVSTDPQFDFLLKILNE